MVINSFVRIVMDVYNNSYYLTFLLNPVMDSCMALRTVLLYPVSLLNFLASIKIIRSRLQLSQLSHAIIVTYLFTYCNHDCETLHTGKRLVDSSRFLHRKCVSHGFLQLIKRGEKTILGLFFLLPRSLRSFFNDSNV